MTPSQIEFYDQCIRNGCTPKFAEMLTLQQPPGVKTDSTYLANSQSVASVVNNGTYQERVLMRRTIEAAAKHGHRPNKNDVYEPQLARFPGDPLAFVPSDSPRHHIQKVCEEQSKECSGAVNVKHRQPERDPLETPRGLGEDMVQEKMVEAVKENPALTKLKKKHRAKAFRELREKIVHTHGS
jgi:hypothetical protein